MLPYYTVRGKPRQLTKYRNRRSTKAFSNNKTSWRKRSENDLADLKRGFNVSSDTQILKIITVSINYG